jgi:hypothetical protein
MGGKQQPERAERPERDTRDRPVEQEADKDIKEGGMEQTGRQKKPEQ